MENRRSIVNGVKCGMVSFLIFFYACCGIMMGKNKESYVILVLLIISFFIGVMINGIWHKLDEEEEED